MWKIIELLLKARKMNIQTLASISQIAPTTIYSWKAGKASPTAEKLARIAKALDVNPEYLMGRTNNPTPTDKLIEDYNKAMQTILMRPNTPYDELQQKYTSLTEENQRALLEYADFLLYKQNKNRP